MYYKNARIFASDFQFHMGGFEVLPDGRFGAVLSGDIPEDATDLHGATVIPGLVDIHNHGNSGADFSDGDLAGLVAMGNYLAKNGITSFAPASMTLPYETLAAAFSTALQLHNSRPEGCARLMGIQMEGPYFSEKKKGAQNADYLKAPDFEGFQALWQGCEGLVRIVDIAPELPGALSFIEKAKDLCTVSLAHTDTDYESAAAAFAAGATHVTHLFNAMPSIGHRAPGLIPAAAECPHARAELICDGLHVHPSCVRLAYSLFRERLILVSDALRCCGMPDGTYELGGQQVRLSGGIARLSDGTIAGSATNLFRCMQNAMDFGIPEEAAVRAATYAPACAIGRQDCIGSIQTGHYADFVVCSPDYTSKTVYLNGRPIT